MKNIFKILLISLICYFISEISMAEEYKFGPGKSSNNYKNTTAGCSPASAFRFLDINNVRARINSGGDMWWDLPGGIGAHYFIPKNGTATSMYSSALWIGGLDINLQLKLAGLRYRQIGQDYWTGPLTIDGTAAVDEATCAEYDKLFLITREEVDQFIAWWESDNKAEEYPGYSIPESILNWPAHGDVAKDQSYYLAPFMDVDGDGDYDPNMGDYPYYDIDNSLCPTNRKPDEPPVPTMEDVLGIVHGGILSDQVIKGDQTLWWVFNDKGNYHSETEGASIGMEIRAQAFAFETNDEINNMTFYSYEIINRSTFELTETYFCPWVDTDLGYAWDDFVGCDVNRGLGYCYNGVAIDGHGEPESYGEQPPAIGVDFFQGPYMDPDGRDNPAFTGAPDGCNIINSPYILDQMAINGVNFGNDIVDDERFGMRRFVYHNNAGGDQGDPSIAPQYYNYLRGIWKDNTVMLYGGNAHIKSGAVGPECEFMFPGDSDPCNWGTNGLPPNGGYNQQGNYWTEDEVGNDPSDRRFMQSAGPFTLTPGAVNYITVGIPWARAISGGPWESVKLLRKVDDLCQSLFDNCFKVIDGPSAPDLSFRELDKELIVYISNGKTSNNYNESYLEVDPFITFPPDFPSAQRDSIYRFEGYQVFQLKYSTVSVESIHDPDLCRLVAQYDIKNGVTKLVNFNYNQIMGANVPVLEVEGGDNGISHSFKITEDAFATEDKRLVNHKQYYFLALAYAYNQFLKYEETPTGLDGQKKPYLAGRKNIKLYTAIPHIPINGIIMHSEYGEIPQITRLEGQGNGGMNIEMTKETIDEILLKKPIGSLNSSGEPIVFGDPEYPIAYNPEYETGKGPLRVKVVDPLNVKKGNYTLKFTDIQHPYQDSVDIESAKWMLIDNETGITYYSDTTITMKYEQLLLDLGLSIDINQINFPGDTFAVNYGFIESSILYEDSSRMWLSGIEDNNVPNSPQNWIRSGTYFSDQNTAGSDWNMPNRAWDPFEFYEKIEVGKWAPYCLTSIDQAQSDVGPAYNIPSKTIDRMEYLASVDIVFTPDKSNWTRAAVIEMCFDPVLAEPRPNGDDVERFELRAGQSVDKDGNPAPVGSGPSDNPDDPNYIGETGMGWFPGYAINLETGERLNIMFGEDSWLVGQNGRDMLFNPTERDLARPDLFDPNIYNLVSGEVLFGGKHYVYVMAHNSFTISSAGTEFKFTSPAYDDCAWAHEVLDTLPSSIYSSLTSYVYGQAMYVGLPMAIKGKEWLSNEATIKIRVAKPYQRYFSLPIDSAAFDHQNNYYPMYSFKTEGISTEVYNAEKAESDLDLINVVPNPYYAYSAYENNALDNRIKFTNLPEKCTVTIYNINGTMIRQYTKDDPFTTIDWDLKNFAGVPIAGGIYLIHVKSNEGERIIKWFGSLRQVDLNIF